MAKRMIGIVNIALRLFLVCVMAGAFTVQAHEFPDDNAKALENVLAHQLAGETEAVKNGLRLKYQVTHSKPGDVITLQPGVYTLKVPSTYNVDRFFHYEGDVIDMKVNHDLTIRGAHPDPTKTIIDWEDSPYAEKLAKGLIVTREAKRTDSFPASVALTVENLTFRDAVGYSNNGAALRPQGNALTVRNCRFINNQNGILFTGIVEQDPVSPYFYAGELIIEDSYFERNGESIGALAHGIYFSQGDRLVVRDSEFVDTKQNGHHIKSLARETIVSGSSFSNQHAEITYNIDTPNAGTVLIVDNSFSYYEAADRDDNHSMFLYASIQSQGGKNPAPVVTYSFESNVIDNYHPNGFFGVIGQEARHAIAGCANIITNKKRKPLDMGGLVLTRDCQRAN